MDQTVSLGLEGMRFLHRRWASVEPKSRRGTKRRIEVNRQVHLRVICVFGQMRPLSRWNPHC